MMIPNVPRHELLPALQLPKPVGLVIAEVQDFDEGDGMRATMTEHELVVEVRTEGNEGSLSIPITLLLEAVQQLTRKYGS